MGRTDNYSIRFDEDKLAFFKEKNPTLEKPQQIIDFFLDEFYWKHKIGVSVNEVPTTGRHIAPPMETIQPPKVDQFLAYQKEIEAAKSASEIEAIVRELKKDTLPDWQKKKLEQFGVEISKTFDF